MWDPQSNTSNFLTLSFLESVSFELDTSTRHGRIRGSNELDTTIGRHQP